MVLSTLFENVLLFSACFDSDFRKVVVAIADTKAQQRYTSRKARLRKIKERSPMLDFRYFRNWLVVLAREFRIAQCSAE